MYEYKVISQQDSLSGVLETAKLEANLNALAKEGWRVISITTGNVIGDANSREEFVVVLERAVKN